jgi:Icc-related predicted phosphoesterase
MNCLNKKLFQNEKISIVAISDTHGKHKQLSNLPKADIIIHCGDMSSMGYEHEIKNFMKWFSSLNQYTYKIIIAGNHDWLYETNKLLAKSLIPNNIIYLEDSGIKINGINFYGTPVSKPFCDWAFNRPESKLIEHWRAIPDNTDVLITHTPPHMIGDYVPDSMRHEGSPSLYDEITKRIKPILHVSGHIHEGHGIQVIDETTFINASNLNDRYECVFEPIYIEI